MPFVSVCVTGFTLQWVSLLGHVLQHSVTLDIRMCGKFILFKKYEMTLYNFFFTY